MPFDVSDVLPKLKQFNTVHYIAHRKLDFKYSLEMKIFNAERRIKHNFL
jgi:hypothetical protein